MSNLHVTVPARSGQYVIDGRRYPRVTSILGIVSKPGLVEWQLRVGRDEANRLRDEGANFGTAVHEACEVADLNPTATMPPKLAPYVEAYCRWRTENVAEVLAVEKTVYHPVHVYAGKLDRLFRLRDERVVIADLKTGGSVDGTTRLQLMAYQEAEEYHGQRIDGRIVLHLPREQPGALKVYDYDDERRDRLAWRATLRLWRWNHRHANDWKGTR